MAVNANDHKSVVIIDDNKMAFGFPHIYSAVAFIERQIVDEDKALTLITEAIQDGVTIDSVKYQVMDVASYLDIFSDDEDEEDE